MRFCSLTCPSVSASVHWHLQRGGIRLGQAVFSRSSLVGKGTWVPTSRKRWCSPSWGIPSSAQHCALELPPCVFYLCCYHSDPPALLLFVAFKCSPSGPCWLEPKPVVSAPSLTACVCVGHPCCRGETGSALFFSPLPSEKINYSISLKEVSFSF